MAAMPFAVIGSEKDVKNNEGKVVKGRQYAWGVAEVENEDHCDFKKLRSILIRTHMLDLIHTTEESHYEAYRAQQMETRKFGEARPRKLDNPKFKEEEENLRKRFTEQVKVEEQRFRQWEQKLIAERDRLNKDLEATHAAYVSISQRPWENKTDPLQYQKPRDRARDDARLNPQPWPSLDFFMMALSKTDLGRFLRHTLSFCDYPISLLLYLNERDKSVVVPGLGVMPRRAALAIAFISDLG
jgi:cell division control protein 12